MRFEYSALVNRPVEEVFAWHGRPGALARLAPPWLPMRVDQEAGSLEDGKAMLRLPGGIRWVATHQAADYEEGRRFADVLTTPGLAALLGWRHTHLFDPEPNGATRITDQVLTRVPARFLAPVFAYRQRQLAGDLASHQRLASRALTVAVTGSSGLVGSALCALLSTGGHQVVRLVRGPASTPDRHWDPGDPDAHLLDGVDAVVHLAGRPIGNRFDAAHKREMRDSRVGPTRRLAEVAARAGVPVFVTASAVGFYGADRGDAELTEASEQGDGFLAELVADWEAASEPASQAGARVVHLRTGIVQSPAGGTLRLLRPLFQAGLGGRLGDGQQWMSWIGIDDIADAYLRAAVDPTLSGPVNAVAPQPVRNSDYTRALATVLRRPALLPVPRFGPSLLLGAEGARELAEASQRVVPAKLQASGHVFRYPAIEPALRHVFGRTLGREP